ncbi:MAG TPA: ABC transporter permease [Frankiaceae bacterium]|jgi:peptide/nickel transport system permease protein|nr:ABC transporter permease [Frankiaceae bacterium]
MTILGNDLSLSGARLPNAVEAGATPIPLKRRRRIRWALYVCGAFATALVLLAVIGPWIVGNPAAGSITDRLLGVGQRGHLLGTDGQGRDILTRLVAGARPSMIAGVTPVLIAGLIGTAAGITAALSGRVGHAVIMRTLDVFYAFPAVLLAIAIAAALGPGTTNAVISLSVVLIAPIARIAETETARLREMDFMEAARASGARAPSIAIRQVLPNIGPALLVYCTAAIGLCLVYAGGLSFLGLGVAPPAPEWGSMINELRQYIFTNPVLALIPALAISVASIVFNVLGDALRDALDVRREARS